MRSRDAHLTNAANAAIEQMEQKQAFAGGEKEAITASVERIVISICHKVVACKRESETEHFVGWIWQGAFQQNSALGEVVCSTVSETSNLAAYICANNTVSCGIYRNG